MLKAIQILGSSSTIGCFSLPSRVNKSRTKFYFIPKRPIFCSFISFRFISTRSVGDQSRRGFTVVGAFQMSHNISHGPFASFQQSTTNAIPSAQSPKVNFCQRCGGATKHEKPAGDEKMRAICTLCGKVSYENPKMIVGCLIEHENKILLCKRNIQPSFGLWTLPAGYMEIGESACEGAVRETHEEANAEVEILSPFAQLDIPLIGQTYMIFLAKLKSPHFSPGPESMECRLFALDDIPFDSLAFSSMLVTLKLYVEDRESRGPKFHYGVINKRPGTGPSDIHAYSLDHHFKC